MNTDLLTAAKLALDALEYCEPDCEKNPRGFDRWSSVMPVLREAIYDALNHRVTGLPHCEKFCEANAFNIEIKRLKAALMERNA